MQPERKRRRKRRYAASIGGVFVVLAIVGIVTVIAGSINLTRRVIENPSERQRIEDIIHPVMMFDPVPFETPAAIDNQQLLLYSMWSALGTEKASTYIYENNLMLVPASDLDVACARLFGDLVTLEHDTFGDYQTSYYYDADTGMYNVPDTALYAYKPEITEMTHAQNDVYYATVAYIPSHNAWTTDFYGNRGEPDPEKYMIYVLKKVGRDYQILAVRDVETDRLNFGEGDEIVLDDDEIGVAE